MQELLSGNEAIARGAWEAGVTVATGYPGTPSTEILEAVVGYKEDIYCEWSPNEKVALEVAAGAAMAGARAIVTMKHVGLNVAADPLMTLSYLGVEGGMVVCVADDPGQHSSQNEQDTRQYARLGKMPVFEPSDSEDAVKMMAEAMEVSERYRTPVILRSTTRVSHSRSMVTLGERRKPNEVGFERNPPRWVPLPLWGRRMRVEVEDRLKALSEATSTSPSNRIELRDTSLGIVAAGIAYQYVREVFPEASVLKISFGYPFPDKLFREFAAKVDKLLIVEELDNILEEHIKALGIECIGKEVVSPIGELSVDRLRETRARLEGRELPEPAHLPEEDGLPGRPPVLCPGCPHRGVFHALGKRDVIVTGDIGCYSLGVFPPLNRTDTILCMGGGVTVAHGMDKAGESRKLVGIVGDSTFFHSGITGLLDVAYNRGKSTTIVVDNRTTAMTGHQEHPGTGLTLMGEPTIEASIEDFGRACGMKRIVTVDPYDLKETIEAVTAEIDADEPSLVISRAPCPLKERKPIGPRRLIDEEVCITCGKCVKLGCPAIESSEERVRINPLLCIGCRLCEQVCPVQAISKEEG
ncbi:MAG: indolepyruvate ferredoxin oxidoreductase subunit alpha [Deltaproteobacteria bacterium]|nr:MAG: indolepyruvate ferredoxin oxidoreductase subunit alpha [Deltaproteobacteria bacterium]